MKRVTSSRRLIFVAEDDSNGLEVHEGALYLLEVNHNQYSKIAVNTELHSAARGTCSYLKCQY